jgi:hypothetical protein
MSIPRRDCSGSIDTGTFTGPALDLRPRVRTLAQGRGSTSSLGWANEPTSVVVVVDLSSIGSAYTVGERENLSCYLEEESLPPPHGISLADAAFLKVLFQTEGALAMGVARDTGYVTRCLRGDGETPS